MKHTIEIEGLPEGWEPVCYRPPNEGEYYLQNGVVYSSIDMTYPRIIVRKKQPRRIVLEETDEDNQTGCGELMDQILCCHDDILIRLSEPKKYWREIKENDSSLTNEEPKLSLTVDECRNMSLSEINMKIVDFLRDK